LLDHVIFYYNEAVQRYNALISVSLSTK